MDPYRCSSIEEGSDHVGAADDGRLGKKSLKEIGKKTRRLLEEERKKRKEIVRLDDASSLPPLPEKEALVAVAKKAAAAESDRNIQPKKAGNAPSARKRKRRVASNIDGWMPNVDDLLSKASAKDDRSNIVRLQGLPIGVKPDHIRKFFHGLNPSIIFVLPSFTNYIQGWDAKYDADHEGAIIKRYSSNFRVFVKFASAPVADAAIERSGEVVGFDTENTACGEREVVGAAISLSHVPKHVATFLQKNMAIHTRKGEAITDTITKAERQMGTIVTQIAWQMAVKKLPGLNSQIIGRRRFNTHNLDYLSNEYIVPTNKLQYEKAAKMYNHLIGTHEKLEVDASLLFTHTFDPSCLEDSVHRITQSVSNWLLDEISILGRLLKESKQSLLKL